MARDYVEFLQSQRLAWRVDPEDQLRPELQHKILSQDPETGACTRLSLYPAGYNHPSLHHLDAAEELFVLRGGLSISGVNYELHDYAWLPAGYPREAVRAEEDTVVISTLDRQGVAQPGLAAAYDSTHLIARMESFAMRWDNSNQDPNISDLLVWRKNLRLAPEGNFRTYLLGGLPQGKNPAPKPKETHPHVEEAFLISGTLACHCGVMQPGAYFWRPPDIEHGLECSATGFLLWMRNPGVNAIITHWTEDKHPVTLTPPHQPVVPRHYGIDTSPMGGVAPFDY